MPLEPKTHKNANCLHEFVHTKCLKCPLFARTHVWRRFLHWSVAVSIMSPGIYVRANGLF